VSSGFPMAGSIVSAIRFTHSGGPGWTVPVFERLNYMLVGDTG
jgi:hypothetical protein